MRTLKRKSHLTKYVSYKKLILLVFLFILKAAAVVFTAEFFGRLIGGVSDGKWQVFVTSAIGLGASYVVLTLIGIISSIFANGIILTINSKIKMNYMQFFLSGKNVGQEIDGHLSYLTNDLKLLEENGIKGELTIIENICLILLSFSYAVSLDWLTTIVFFLGALAPVAIGQMQNKKIEVASKALSNANEKYTTNLKNLLLGKDTLIIYQAIEEAKNRFSKSLYHMEKSSNQLRNHLKITNELSILAFIFFGVILPISVGGYRVLTGHLSLTLFFVIFQLNGSISNPLVEIIECLTELKTVKQISTRLTEAEANTVDIPTQMRKQKIDTISLQNALIRVGEKNLIENLDMTIRNGDKLLISGPSGFGKTTLLNTLWGKYQLDDGEYVINDEKVLKEKTFDYLSSFSLIKQKPLIFNDTIHYNVTLGKSFSDAEFNEALMNACLTELVEEKTSDYIVGENGENLSGGQLQRIEIARALIRKRPVLLADEPTSALDPELSKVIHANLLSSSDILIEVAHKISADEAAGFTKILKFPKE